MKAGRELDELIAKNIFGWIDHKTFEANSTNLIKGFLTPNGYFKYHFEIPKFSTEMSQAWKIVEKIPARFCLIKEDFGSHERPYKAYFMRTQEEGCPVSYSDSMAHVICLAALKAVEK